MTSPFLTRCISERAISPLRAGDEVEVVGMGPEEACAREMFVETPWKHKRTLALPLSQLKVVNGNDETQQAVEDWHYWVGMGYEF
jgi:Calcium binding